MSYLVAPPQMDALGHVFADVSAWIAASSNVPVLTGLDVSWSYTESRWQIKAHLAAYPTEVEGVQALIAFAGSDGVVHLSAPQCHGGDLYRLLTVTHRWGAYEITVWDHLRDSLAPYPTVRPALAA